MNNQQSNIPSQGPQQVFCPYCRGGNPSVAAVCMWCGRPLNIVVQPYPPPVNVTVQNKYSFWPCIVVPLVLVFCCIAFYLLGTTAWFLSAGDSGNKNAFQEGDPARYKTPISGVYAPTYEEMKAVEAQMNDTDWKQYQSELEGMYVLNWQGTVSGLQAQMFNATSELEINVDPSNTRVYRDDVVIEIPRSEASKLKNGDRIVFSGKIRYVIGSGDNFSVYLEDAIYRRN